MDLHLANVIRTHQKEMEYLKTKYDNAVAHCKSKTCDDIYCFFETLLEQLSKYPWKPEQWIEIQKIARQQAERIILTEQKISHKAVDALWKHKSISWFVEPYFEGKGHSDCSTFDSLLQEYDAYYKSGFQLDLSECARHVFAEEYTRCHKRPKTNEWD